MCAAKNTVDDIGDYMQEKKERDDLLHCQDMKVLDDLLESIEDHETYYTEIFDTLMYAQVTSLMFSFVH